APEAPAAAAMPAPAPITPAHHGGRFQVVQGRAFDVVLDPNVPPARAWRLTEAPGFIQHVPPAGGHPLGGEPPQTAAFHFFASSPGEGALVFTEPYGSQFRVTIVAVGEQAPPPATSPLPPGAAISLNTIPRGGRVEVEIGRHMLFYATHSSSRGDVVEPSDVPHFVEYLGARPARPNEPENWGGSNDYIYTFVARGAGEGDLVIREYNQRDGGETEVFRATIVARR
ncbi:MAG TPA: hypothetical protein PLK37_04235, partial [Terricaulis sp.]|nr:hypothetical protein [Terricaulis sp.]